ncbi:uroplakin-3a isoform X4 [Suricata suricatta]|uniref:uroplakin-3a isoform X4 n=1 Tax=Suricata suricatta TaxID=37032 RepID=UPI001155B158|nr:uroplakin-3a isoform X4 [Suricata suricatta]
MPPLWALLALGCLRLGLGVNLKPQLASVTFATNNPTLTTVALEKPLCVFDSLAALDGPCEVYLYVLVDLASSRNASVQDATETPLSSTFQQTEGGRTGPYKAAAFDLTPCGDLPSLDAVGDVARASEILDAYLVRVGANVTCLSDPNFHGLCNPPLSGATEYSPFCGIKDQAGNSGRQTFYQDKWVQVRPPQHVHGLGSGPDPMVRPHPHQQAHPLLSDRHVAGPAERGHDRHHVHPGLPALLPAPRLCRRHCPQPPGRGRF